jgi:hypothetical protein
MIVFIGCIYMVQTSCVPIYFSTTHYTLPRKLPFSGQCERLSRRLVGVEMRIIHFCFVLIDLSIPFVIHGFSCLLIFAARG